MYWLIISSTLFDIYQEKSTGGATYESPDKQMTLTLYQLGFVDDVMNRTNLSWEVEDPDQAMAELIEQASKDSQLWHDVLESSNQTLELTKCKYHVIHYDFEESGAPILVTDSDPPHPLQVHSATGEPKTIKHISTFTFLTENSFPYYTNHYFIRYKFTFVDNRFCF